MKQKTEKLDSVPHISTPILALAIAVISIFLMKYNLWLSIAVLICSVGIFFEKVLRHFGRIRKMREYISNAASDENELQNNEALFKSMCPIAGIRVDGSIAWYNSAFRDLFQSVNDKKISELLPEINIREIYNSGGHEGVDISCGDDVYHVRATVTRRVAADHAAIMIYMEKVTELISLRERLDDSECAVANIMVDNYDEAMDCVSEEERLDVASLIDKNILGWMQDVGGLAKKTEKDKYLCIFTKKQLKEFVENKFQILKLIKECNPGMKNPPTVSIGIGIGGKEIGKNSLSSKKALDMALGRGGDQAVIRENGKFTYFGGNSKETEKRTKVKARIMAHNLRELFESCDNVLIMGHRDSDADAIGAAIGIANLAEYVKKEAKVLLITRDDTVHLLLKKIEDNHYHDDMFIGKAGLREFITPKTLLVICDTHVPEYTEMPELIDSIKTKVVIDHHRRSENFIPDADLVYHEPFASSTCEMVTEIMQYFGSHYAVSTVDAEALYCGIAVDTKNFTFKTGVRTFEAAAYLRAAGVDTLHVKKLLRKSIENYKLKAGIVSRAHIYSDNIAISVYQEEVPHLVIASAADELLEITDVKASFVIARDEASNIIISGRSLGEINVQLVLEKLGGGGHMMVAGAQLKDVLVEEAETMLKNAIEELNL